VVVTQEIYCGIPRLIPEIESPDFLTKIFELLTVSRGCSNFRAITAMNRALKAQLIPSITCMTNRRAAHDGAAASHAASQQVC